MNFALSKLLSFEFLVGFNYLQQRQEIFRYLAETFISKRNVILKEEQPNYDHVIETFQ